MNPSWRSSLPRPWALKCLALCAVGSALDYATVLTLIGRFGVRTSVAAACGLVMGGGINFATNRVCVFRSSGRLGNELLRFVVSFGALLMLHATVVGLLRDRLGVPILIAKPLADLTILGASQPWVLRCWVFRAEPAAAMERQLSPSPAR